MSIRKSRRKGPSMPAHDIHADKVPVFNPSTGCAPPTPLPRDPWAHRSVSMRCATCMWFAPKGGSTLGRCRRHAPAGAGFMPVFVTDWCGDHRLDENAV